MDEDTDGGSPARARSPSPTLEDRPLALILGGLSPKSSAEVSRELNGLCTSQHVPQPVEQRRSRSKSPLHEFREGRDQCSYGREGAYTRTASPAPSGLTPRRTPRDVGLDAARGSEQAMQPGHAASDRWTPRQPRPPDGSSEGAGSMPGAVTPGRNGPPSARRGTPRDAVREAAGSILPPRNATEAGSITGVDPHTLFPAVGESAMFEAPSARPPAVPPGARRSSSPGPPPSVGAPVAGLPSAQAGPSTAAMPLVFELTPTPSRRGTPRNSARAGAPVMEPNAAFDLLDVNGDGVISRAEFATAMQGKTLQPLGNRLALGPVTALGPPGYETDMTERMRRRVSNMKNSVPLGPPPSAMP